jgi:hypothetical protein
VEASLYFHLVSVEQATPMHSESNVTSTTVYEVSTTRTFRGVYRVEEVSSTHPTGRDVDKESPTRRAYRAPHSDAYQCQRHRLTSLWTWPTPLTRDLYTGVGRRCVVEAGTQKGTPTATANSLHR